jgi:hypothetical protein
MVAMLPAREAGNHIGRLLIWASLLGFRYYQNFKVTGNPVEVGE